MTSHKANSAGGQGASHAASSIGGLAHHLSPRTGSAVSSPIIHRTPTRSQRPPRINSSQSVTFSPDLTAASTTSSSTAASPSSSSSSRSRSIPRRLLAPVLHAASRSHHLHSGGRQHGSSGGDGGSGGSSATSTTPASSASSPSTRSSGGGGSSMDPPSSPGAGLRSRSRSRDDTDASANNGSDHPPSTPRRSDDARPVVATSSSASASSAASSPRTPRGSSRRLRSPLSNGGGGGSGKKKSLFSSSDADAVDAASAAACKTADDAALRAKSRTALSTNDAMVYLDGPNLYACATCRTHLTSHDSIISKSFHGRHGRAYLFESCVNVTYGDDEDRLLITGMHSVCDIKCKRCETVVGWTYKRAYESSQKYKEGKFIVEKIHLHLEEGTAGAFDGVGLPAGERGDRWRKRSVSWGSAADGATSRGASRRGGGGRDRVTSFDESSMVYEYRPELGGGDSSSPYRRTQSLIAAGTGQAGADGGSGARVLPPGPPNL